MVESPHGIRTLRSSQWVAPLRACQIRPQLSITAPMHTASYYWVAGWKLKRVKPTSPGCASFGMRRVPSRRAPCMSTTWGQKATAGYETHMVRTTLDCPRLRESTTTATSFGSTRTSSRLSAADQQNLRRGFVGVGSNPARAIHPEAGQCLHAVDGDCQRLAHSPHGGWLDSAHPTHESRSRDQLDVVEIRDRAHTNAVFGPDRDLGRQVADCRSDG